MRGWLAVGSITTAGVVMALLFGAGLIASQRPEQNLVDLPKNNNQAPMIKMSFNETRVRDLALKHQLQLPESIELSAPAAATPAIQYIGAWGSDEPWKETGQPAMLIIEKIDNLNGAHGVYTQGAPSAAGPAAFAFFSSIVRNDGLYFLWGPFKYTFMLVGDRMVGHSEGPGTRGRVDSTITLRRIE
jgi:hypothetical protein